MRKNKPDDGSVSIKDVQQDDKVLLKKRILDLTGEANQLRLQIAERGEFGAQVAAALAAADPFPRVKYRMAMKKSHIITPVIKLSDWHIGEVIRKEETEFFGEFNWAIAQERIFHIVSSILRWIENQRALYRIEDCFVLCEGDWISGDIHDELMATNEFPVPVQTAKAGLLLGEVLAILAPHFRRLNVYAVGADNHGRLRKKPQAKQKSSNNYSYLVYEITMTYLRKHNNVTIVRPDAGKVLVDVNGYPILSEHGDTVRGWSGHPYYGFDRRVGKEAFKRMNTNLGFKTWSIGHFHVPASIEDGKIIINGSLSGTSEFDHLNGRHAGPGQVAFLIHPIHGIFNFTSFRGSK